jgi:hypothetical protein
VGAAHDRRCDGDGVKRALPSAVSAVLLAWVLGVDMRLKQGYSLPEDVRKCLVYGKTCPHNKCFCSVEHHNEYKKARR